MFSWNIGPVQALPQQGQSQRRQKSKGRGGQSQFGALPESAAALEARRPTRQQEDERPQQGFSPQAGAAPGISFAWLHRQVAQTNRQLLKWLGRG